MKLVSAKVGPFRSINTVQDVVIDPEVTVFVGMNEAGKTVFLKALHKSLDAMDVEEFDPVEDYPRKDYSAYMKRHATEPEAATALTYQPTDDLITKINSELHTNLQPGFQFLTLMRISKQLQLRLMKLQLLRLWHHHPA